MARGEAVSPGHQPNTVPWGIAGPDAPCGPLARLTCSIRRRRSDCRLGFDDDDARAVGGEPVRPLPFVEGHGRYAAHVLQVVNVE